MGRNKLKENELTISKHKKNSLRHISIRNDLFKNDVVYNVEWDKIVFRLAGIDDNANIMSLKDRKGLYATTINSNEYIPIGVFKIDEDESNEDQIVVYFEDII